MVRISWDEDDEGAFFQTCNSGLRDADEGEHEVECLQCLMTSELYHNTMSFKFPFTYYVATSYRSFRKMDKVQAGERELAFVSVTFKASSFYCSFITINGVRSS